MPAKLNIYGLGQYGINRTASPLQVKDGELLVCQNALPTPLGAQVGLRKRDGMDKINAEAAAGTLLAIGNIPFSDAGYVPLGETWTTSGMTSPTLVYNDVAWSPTAGIFVACADHNASGSIATSTDGITWTQRVVSATNLPWNKVKWSATLGLFVMSGNSPGTANYFATSPDGINWSEPTVPASSQGYGVAVGDDIPLVILVPLGSAFDILHRSSTAASSSWTTYNTSGAVPWMLEVVRAVELSRFVSVGSTGTAGRSTDGITWTASTTPSGDWWGVDYSPELNLFVAVAQTGTNRVMTSTDGITWTAGTPAEVTAWRDVTHYNGVFVAVASAGTNRVMKSTDGFTWTGHSAAAANQWWACTIAPELEMIVAVAQTGVANSRIMRAA